VEHEDGRTVRVRVLWVDDGEGVARIGEAEERQAQLRIPAHQHVSQRHAAKKGETHVVCAPAQDDGLPLWAKVCPLDRDGALVPDVEARMEALMVWVDDPGCAVLECCDEDEERRAGRHGEVEVERRARVTTTAGGCGCGQGQGPRAQDLEGLYVAQHDAVLVDRDEAVRVWEEHRRRVPVWRRGGKR